MIRDIRHLSKEHRYLYGKGLFNLMVSLEDFDERILKEYYKIASYIKLPIRERQQMIKEFLELKENVNTPLVDIKNLYQHLNKELKNQEKNVMKFMLLEDIQKLIFANDLKTEEKQILQDGVVELLEIKNYGEFESHHSIIYDEESGKKKFAINNKCFESMAYLSLPLIMLYFSKHNAYRHDWKSYLILQGEKKFQRDLEFYSLGKKVAGGLALTWGFKKLLNRKNRKKNKELEGWKDFQKKLNKEAEKLMKEDLKYMKSEGFVDSHKLRQYDLFLMKNLI